MNGFLCKIKNWMLLIHSATLLGVGCDLSVITRIRSAWGKFRELLPILTSHALSYIHHMWANIQHVYPHCLVACQ